MFSLSSWLLQLYVTGWYKFHCLLYDLHNTSHPLLRRFAQMCLASDLSGWTILGYIIFHLLQVRASFASELIDRCSPACDTCTGPSTSQCLSCAAPRMNLAGSCVGYATSTGICDSTLSGLNGTFVVNNEKSACEGTCSCIEMFRH